MTVLATYGRVDIVSTPDTLGGKPRLDGHRISVFTLELVADDSGIEGALESYPHLTEAQVKAARKYCEEHPDELAQYQRTNEDLQRCVEHRQYRCACGELFDDPIARSEHAKERGDGHAIAGDHFPGTIVCTCGESFDDIVQFRTHAFDDSWPRDEHFVEAIKE